jgi:hypothetical protein
MKKILALSVGLILLSCREPKYVSIGQEIVDGKVSATKIKCGGRVAQYHNIWVQTDKVTKQIEIPFEFDGRWNVGDSCLLIIQKYKEIESK